MFRAGNHFEVDLASLNIQRGRNHGLRPYNDHRVLVGLESIKDFAEFGEEVTGCGRSAGDVDLWVGELIEEKTPGSILGVTFRDIIADQFSKLIKGDGYFFEDSPIVNPGYFILDQLRELKKVTISGIICDRNDKVLMAHQTLNAFRKPGIRGNEIKSRYSDEIPGINFMYWEEEF